MNRRSFFKRSFGALMVIGLAKMASAFASTVVEATEGKLGYKKVSKFQDKNCLNCKHYKAVEGKKLGECPLEAMKKIMNADVVLVEPLGYCNVWAKKA